MMWQMRLRTIHTFIFKTHHDLHLSNQLNFFTNNTKIIDSDFFYSKLLIYK